SPVRGSLTTYRPSSPSGRISSSLRRAGTSVATPGMRLTSAGGGGRSPRRRPARGGARPRAPPKTPAPPRAPAPPPPPPRLIPPHLAEHGQVVQGQGRVRVARAQEPLLQRQGALVESLGLRSLPLRVVQGSEVVQVDGDLVVIRTVGALEDCQRPAVERLRLVILALAVQERRQGGYVRGHGGMFGAQRLLAE